MKHYRLNQIAMAVLGALLLIFGTKTLINIAFEEHEPEKPGYQVAAAKHEERAGEKPAVAASDLPALLAKADAARGETTAAVCKACHSFEAGQPSPIGPNLHDLVGREIASVDGFNYSPALKAHAEEEWSYENLNHWLTNPQVFASGTTMGFPGLPDAKQRADVILFLRSKTENAPPLPQVTAAAPAAEGAKPAEGATKAGPEAAPGAHILPTLAKADPKKGEAAAAACKVCHSFDKGAPSPIGPNLYGVVGRKIASVEGFNYSPALKAKASEGDWTFEHLDLWLTNPQAFAPGTAMAFPGLPDLTTRADVIDFLRTKSDNPVPLPEATPAAPAPKAETPAAAPETPKTEARAPAPEASKAEQPAPAPEAPKAEQPAPSAETPVPPAPEAPKSEETAPAQQGAEERTPASEEAPAAESVPAAAGDFSEPSIVTQPQPAYPESQSE
ncbi:MAG TPA: cytochrome c family protein [Methyloceanibacter sp.]|nr:cytochrome c family protein [Methyloceanibacter sp.]